VICSDLAAWRYSGPTPDLIWASPPCTYFSLARTDQVDYPDMSLYYAARRIIFELRPRFWVIENVRGACRFFEGHYKSYGPWFLWGNLPELPVRRGKWALNKHTDRGGAAQRARVPFELSQAVAVTVERSLFLF